MDVIDKIINLEGECYPKNSNKHYCMIKCNYVNQNNIQYLTLDDIMKNIGNKCTFKCIQYNIKILKLYFLHNKFTLEYHNKFKKCILNIKRMFNILAEYILRNKPDNMTYILHSYLANAEIIRYSINIQPLDIQINKYLDNIDKNNNEQLSFLFSKIYRKRMDIMEKDHFNTYISNNIKNYKLTSKLFASFCDIINEENLLYFLNNKIIFDDNCFKRLLKNNNFSNFMQIVYCYGFTPSYKNILDSIKKSRVIPNIKEFNIAIDYNIVLLSIKYNFFGYEKIYNFDHNIDTLHLACKKSNIKLVKHICQSVKPDKKCLDIVINRSNANKHIEYFMNDHDMSPTLENLKNYSLVIRKNILYEMLDKYEKNLKENN